MATTDNHVFLIGRPPAQEFLGFIRSMAVDGQTADMAPLTEEWRVANDYVQALEVSEAGIADNVPTFELPADVVSLVDEVTKSPAFHNAFRMVPCDFVMVELDRLVVFQKFINTGYVDGLKETLSATPSNSELVRFAFGIGRELPPVTMMQSSQNTYTFISPSGDFRFLDAALLPPAQVSAPAANGHPVAFLGLSVGFGANFLSALSVEGRLILTNGSHRAYCLRAMGITRAPFIVQRITRRDELTLVASGDVGSNPDRYLKDKRPPLLKDYFDPKLTKVIAVARKKRMVRIQYLLDQSDVPDT